MLWLRTTDGNAANENGGTSSGRRCERGRHTGTVRVSVVKWNAVMSGVNAGNGLAGSVSTMVA
jgi:hypothetical protein